MNRPEVDRAAARGISRIYNREAAVDISVRPRAVIVLSVFGVVKRRALFAKRVHI